MQVAKSPLKSTMFQMFHESQMNSTR